MKAPWTVSDLPLPTAASEVIVPREYPYLVASLPLLEFGEEPPMTAEELVAFCAGLLSSADLATLELVVAGRIDDIDDPGAYTIMRRERQLRNAVARHRAGRAGVDSTRYVRPHEGWDVEIEDVVGQAMVTTDPLERESMLDRLRWQLLEEAAAIPEYGVQAVYAYAPRLALMEKWQQLTDERGMGVAEQIIDSNIAEISV